MNYTLTGTLDFLSLFFLQLLALKQQNKHLVLKLKNTKIDGSLHTCNYGLNNSNDDQDSNIDSSNDSCAKSSDEEVIDHFNAAFQAGTYLSALSF